MKSCNIFELMCDIVLEWTKRNKIPISTKELNDLKTRLSNAQAVLKLKYNCTKANRIEIET